MSDLNMIEPKSVQGIINKFCYTIGMLPSSYKVSLTYEEQILCIGKYLEDTVYPAINNNAEALAELQTLFQELKNYVDNFFDDLNIQNEINNKLDEMADSGELADIINQQIFQELNTKINTANSAINDLQLDVSNLQDETMGTDYINSKFLNNLKNDTNQTILFSGDSLTLGGDPTASNNFPTVFRDFINDWYENQNLTIINRGVGGALSQKGLDDFESYLSSNPTTIFWSYGTNDITQNVTLTHIIENLNSFYKLCVQNNIELIVIIPPPNFKNNFRSQGMKMLATVMESYCLQHGILYVNAYKYINNLYETLAYSHVELQPDQTHFADYTVLSDAILHDLIPCVYVQSEKSITNFAFNRQPNRIKTDATVVNSTTVSPFQSGYQITSTTTVFEFNIICTKPSIVYLNSYARSSVADITLKIDNQNFNLNAHNANNTSNDNTSYMINIRIPVLLKPGKHKFSLVSFNGTDSQRFYAFGLILQEIQKQTSVNSVYWQRAQKMQLFSGNETNASNVALTNPIANCNELKVLTGTNGANNFMCHTINMTEPYRYFNTDGNHFKFPVCSNDGVTVGHLTINGIANTFSYEGTVPIRAIYGYNNLSLNHYEPDLLEEYESSNNNGSIDIS